jgi:hypothetical protein
MSEQMQPPGATFDLPSHLLDLLATLPAMIDRSAGAALVSKCVFPTTPQTVKGWQIRWSYPNGRALAPPAAYLEYAYRKSRSAPQPRGRPARRMPAEAA